MCTIYITWPATPEPDVCPGCGHCRQCGRYVGDSRYQPLYPASPVYPLTPAAPNPYIGDPSPSDWPSIIVSDEPFVCPSVFSVELPLPPGEWKISAVAGNGAGSGITWYFPALD